MRRDCEYYKTCGLDFCQTEYEQAGVDCPEYLPKIKPMLLNTEMVRALLDDRKTVTRRVIKPQPTNPRYNCIGWLGWDDGHGYKMSEPYKVGDILYVRETWAKDESLPYGNYFYRADGDNPHGWYLEGWHPSIHMPKEAARIFLRVTGVRVERLQEITEEQAKAEGARKSPFTNPTMRYAPKESQEISVETYMNGFKEIWFDTLPKYYTDDIAFEGNPWVWVIEFERCENPEEANES